MEMRETKLPRGDILVVDDSPTNLQILVRMLGEQGYKVRPVPSGRMALSAARANTPDVILLDIDMPDMNGFETCEAFKADPTLRDVPVIFISGHVAALDKVRAFAVGGVDYVMKPFQIEEVLARVETHIRITRLQRDLENTNRNLAQMVAAQVREIAELQLATIYSMANLAECRDKETGDHLGRVRELCRLLARCLADRQLRQGIDEAFIATLYETSPLHDIGKVGIPDAILLKPGKLSPEEFEIIKTHTLIGAKTLEAVQRQFPDRHFPFVEMGIEVAKYHHERWDGTGYPAGLAGEGIPLAARIMAVVDVYDALTSRRVYKDAVSHEEASGEICAGAGTHFDPVLVEAFTACGEAFRELRESHGGGAA